MKKSVTTRKEAYISKRWPPQAATNCVFNLCKREREGYNSHAMKRDGGVGGWGWNSG